MKSGAVVVALLSKGASVVQYRSTEKSRAVVAVGRNKDARIPVDRVVLATDYVPGGHDELEEFRRNCEAIAASIDLSEVWDVVKDEEAPAAPDDLAELYWTDSPDEGQRVAMALHVDLYSDHFVRKDNGYAPRTAEAIEEIQTRRRREADYASDADALMQSLAEGNLPEPLTTGQESQLRHLREYAVHGDDYARGHAARELLGRAVTGSRDLQRTCFAMLVAADVFSQDEPLEVIRADVPVALPADAVSEAEAVADDPPRIVDAVDLTGLHAFTIDDPGTQERDDALSFDTEADGPPYQLGVHIAYAGMLVPRSGAMDMEADRRMATLYLPERRIDMLPPAFSRGVGSLDPDETRHALSLTVALSAEGEPVDWELKPSTLRSEAALSYDEVSEAVSDELHPRHAALSGLERAAKALRNGREEAGAISLDQPEMTIRVDHEGVHVRVAQRDSPGRQLVAEMAILYNVLVAEFCKSEGIPAVYRVQAPPDLSGVADGPEPLRRYQIARRLFPADLDLDPGPHGGLGVTAYLQATSPLRRYPDLVMQRQVAHYMSTGEHFYSREEIASVMQRAEVQLRELSRLEDTRRRYWFLRFLESSVLGAAESDDANRRFEAVVLENEPHRRALLELGKYPFRLRAEVPRQIEPGERVTLELQDVDLWRRLAHFVHAERTS